MTSPTASIPSIDEVVRFINIHNRYPNSKENKAFYQIKLRCMRNKLTQDRVDQIRQILPYFDNYIAKCKDAGQRRLQSFTIDELKNYNPKDPQQIINDFKKDKSFIYDINKFVNINNHFPNSRQLGNFSQFIRKYFGTTHPALRSTQEEILTSTPYLKEYLEVSKYYEEQKVEHKYRHYDLETLHQYQTKGIQHLEASIKRKLTPINTIEDIEKMAKYDDESSMLNDDDDEQEDEEPEIQEPQEPTDYINFGIEHNIITNQHLNEFEQKGYNIKTHYKIKITTHNYFRQLNNEQFVSSSLIKEFMSLQSAIQPRVITDYLQLGFEANIFTYETYKAFELLNKPLPSRYKKYIYPVLFNECLATETEVPFHLFRDWVLRL